MGWWTVKKKRKIQNITLSKIIYILKVLNKLCHVLFLCLSYAVELQQAYEVDSLEYLEALETVTDKLETRVNFCKAHLMMITCFDVSSRHR